MLVTHKSTLFLGVKDPSGYWLNRSSAPVVSVPFVFVLTLPPQCLLETHSSLAERLQGIQRSECLRSSLEQRPSITEPLEVVLARQSLGAPNFTRLEQFLELISPSEFRQRSLVSETLMRNQLLSGSILGISGRFTTNSHLCVASYCRYHL